MPATVQPRLIGLGAVLIVAGVVTMLFTLWHAAGPEAALVGSEVPADVAASGAPSRLWAVLGGCVIAAGAALVGIGMNRWRRQA